MLFRIANVIKIGNVVDFLKSVYIGEEVRLTLYFTPILLHTIYYYHFHLGEL
jgi:hypothetical protein